MKKQRFSSISKSNMVSRICLIYILVNVLTEVSSQTQGLTLKISQGEITGTFEWYEKSGDEYKYSVFRGIPYAKPPVGPFRLKDPEKHDDWSSALDASNFGSICPQWDSQGNLVGNEDCLYINVYTPMSEIQNPTPTNYPVMVFLHGGKFQQGSSNLYEQYRFIDSQVILVTLNYRLGVLGFLSTGDDACPGNLGLKDQNLALQWVRDNIQFFGGNSSSITLFGQSAGAVSVFLHILSPMSQGLFHQAIAQSGTPFCDWTIEEDPRKYAEAVAKKLSCSTKSSSTMIDCIRNKPVQEVLQAQEDSKTFGDFPLRAVPVVERDGFLPDTPTNLMNSGNFKPVPLISGINKDDGALMYPLIQSHEETLKKNSSFLLTQLIPMFILSATDIKDNIESVSQAVYFQYFNGIDRTNVTQVLQPFVNVSTDAMFVSCNYRTVQSYSAKGARVYMYTFEYKGQYSMLELQNGNKFTYEGVSHGDELLYLFEMKNAKLTMPLDEQKQKQLVFLWTTFAKTGSFPVSATPEYPKWEPYNSETKYYYKIESTILKQSSYRQREIDFWLDHLPALSKIIPTNNQSKPDYVIGGFGWAMFAIAVILLIVLIVVTVKYLQKTNSKYFMTKTEDK